MYVVPWFWPRQQITARSAAVLVLVLVLVLWERATVGTVSVLLAC